MYFMGYNRVAKNELGWRARTGIEWKGAWPEEAIHVNFCGQDVGAREHYMYTNEISDRKLP